MALRCEGRVVVVTGGAMGIGYALAKGLLAEGATVVIADRDGAAEAAAALDTNRAIGGACDVSSQDETEAMAGAAVDAFGRIDVLVNNAGIYSSLTQTPFEELTADDWRRGSRRQCHRPGDGNPGGGPGHAAPGRRSDRQHLVGHPVQGCSVPAALRGEQGSGQPR